jgi:hypothetical protein
VSRAKGREMAATIEAQRQQLFQASAIVAVCRCACASKYETDPEQLAAALRVVEDMIDNVGGNLEEFAGDEATRQEGDE